MPRKTNWKTTSHFKACEDYFYRGNKDKIFFQTLFETPADGEACLVFNRFGGFEILVWDESQGMFYDEKEDVFHDFNHARLWAYPPFDECEKFDEKTTIRGCSKI